MSKENLKKYFMPLTMIAFSLVIYLISLFVVDDILAFTKGILFGLIFALLKLKLMENTFEKAVTLTEHKARTYTQMQYMLRYVLTGVVLVVAALDTGISLLGVFFGLISMKFAAYLQLCFKF